LTGSYTIRLNRLLGHRKSRARLDGDARSRRQPLYLFAGRPNATDGKIKWHFQLTPHDVHDWDSNEIPVLFDATINGRPRKLVAMANATRSTTCSIARRENF